jgi:hypothetical protein
MDISKTTRPDIEALLRLLAEFVREGTMPGQRKEK